MPRWDSVPVREGGEALGEAGVAVTFLRGSDCKGRRGGRETVS